jgi:hypothetical protein
MEYIKNQYVETLILISPNWKLEFHVPINVSYFVITIILIQN